MSRSSNLFLSFALLISVGCGGDDDDLGSRSAARVIDIEVDDASLVLGQGTVVRTNFSFDYQSVFSDGTNVVVVVKLGDGLRYRSDTAEIQGSGDDDNALGPQITRCLDGTTFLVFDMDEHDLDDASNPDGGAGAQLSLTVDAVGAVGQTAVGGRADYDQSIFGCNETFFADEATGLTVF